MEYKQSVTDGPTYRFVCNDCGHKAGYFRTAGGSKAFHCEHCDVTTTLKGIGAYKVEKVRVA